MGSCSLFPIFDSLEKHEHREGTGVCDQGPDSRLPELGFEVLPKIEEKVSEEKRWIIGENM